MHRRTGALSRAGRGPSSPPREDRAAGKKVRKNGRDRALLAMDEPYHKIVCLNSLICPGCEKKYFCNFSIKTRQLAVCSPFFAGSGACRGLGLSSGCLLKRTTKGNYRNFMKYFMQTGAHGGVRAGRAGAATAESWRSAVGCAGRVRLGHLDGPGMAAPVVAVCPGDGPGTSLRALHVTGFPSPAARRQSRTRRALRVTGFVPPVRRPGKTLPSAHRGRRGKRGPARGPAPGERRRAVPGRGGRPRWCPGPAPSSIRKGPPCGGPSMKA